MIIDVTQLVHWHGKLTGIPRVMYELATRYAESSESIFVTWSPETKKYLEINLQKTLDERGRKIYYTYPYKRSILYTTLARFIRKLKREGISIPYKIISFIEGNAQPAKQFNFSEDDTLFVLWGEQGSDDFIKELKNIKDKKVKLIQVVYDLLPLITPHYSGHSTDSMNKYTREIIPNTDLVLSISENTKSDLQGWLKKQNLKLPKIEFFRLGDDFKISRTEKPTQEIFKASRINGNDYILTVGTIEARKNHTILYYAYKLAKIRNIELPKIILVGRKGWMAEEVHSFITKDPDINDKFVVIEDVSDEQLSWLYDKALFTVYPSFYEGWGLPIAESISRGTPCICSNTSSMPEVAGELANYFNPCSTDECLSAITSMLKPGTIKAEKNRIQKYKTTSWNSTFIQVKQHIEEIYVKKN